MTHDPYQTYPTFAGYPAATNPGLGYPFSSPYSAMQTSAMNPAAGYNPFAAQQPGIQGIQGFGGQPNYGGPQQWPATTPFAGWQNPFGGYQNPLAAAALQNPLVAAALQNPLVAYALQLQNPFVNPLLAQLASQGGYGQQHTHMGHPLAGLGQQISPFAQFNTPNAQFNPQLAPQSWVGQGQGNPLLAQFAARAMQGAPSWPAF